MQDNIYDNLTLTQFLDQLAAPNFPGPIGGSAAAAGAAMAASLLELCCNVTILKQNNNSELKNILKKHVEIANDLRRTYLSLGAADMEAYAAVVKAAKKKKENPEDFKKAMKLATNTLVDIVKNSQLLLEEMSKVVDVCYNKALGDLLCGVHLTDAALATAKKGVEINISDINDKIFIEKTMKIVNEAYGKCIKNKQNIIVKSCGK